jgi:hypothetical protein
MAMIAATVASAAAQTMDRTTVDSIVGSGIEEDETTAAATESKVLAAIDRTAETAARVRKTSSVDHVDIVFLSDTARSEGGPPPRIAESIRQHETEVAELRQEIEANALIFHAIDSRRVLVADVLGVDFPDPKTVVIYAAAKPPG